MDPNQNNNEQTINPQTMYPPGYPMFPPHNPLAGPRVKIY